VKLRILKLRLDIGIQFDDFWDKVSEAELLFKTGVNAYLSDNMESFEKRIKFFIQQGNAVACLKDPQSRRRIKINGRK
jgi:hypothetical protein